MLWYATICMNKTNEETIWNLLRSLNNRNRENTLRFLKQYMYASIPWYVSLTTNEIRGIRNYCSQFWQPYLCS